jgi:hypothetical protein
MTLRATTLLPALGSIAALLCASACVYANPTTPALHGEFAVGTVAADWPREVEGSKRRLKIRIWYPARQTSPSAQARRYLDTTEAQRTIESIERFLEAPGSLSMLADAMTQSFENAPIAADGRYAVVLFNHGFWFYLAQNTALMETLASHS